MRILVIGATGTIGEAIVDALKNGNEIVPVSHRSTPITVDLASGPSIRTMLDKVGKVDAIVCAAGNAKFVPMEQLSDDDFDFSLRNKLMGQVNLIRYGLPHVNDGGSITITSGILGRAPMTGSAAVSLVNAGLEGFARAAALEAPRGIRVNVVSPPWVTETLKALKMDPSHGLPAATVARSYAQSVTGKATGQVVEPSA